MSVALTDAHSGPPSARSEFGDGGGGDFGDERDVAGNADPGPVAHQVKFAGLAGPDVAGAAFRVLAVKGDRVGPDGHECGAVDGGGGGHQGAVGEADGGAGRFALEQVESDHGGDPG